MGSSFFTLNSFYNLPVKRGCMFYGFFCFYFEPLREASWPSNISIKHYPCLSWFHSPCQVGSPTQLARVATKHVAGKPVLSCHNLNFTNFTYAIRISQYFLWFQKVVRRRLFFECKMVLYTTAFFILFTASTWAGFIASHFLFGRPCF